MRTYVPSGVNLSILGIDVDGFPDGTFITITPQNQTFTFRSALDGSTMAVKSTHQEYKITITLEQTSASNDWLQILHDIKKSMPVAIQTPIMINDKSGSTTFFATDCWLSNEVTSNFSNGIENVQWEIWCKKGVYKRGGNGGVNDAISIISSIQSALSYAGIFGYDLGIFKDQLSNVVGSVNSDLLEFF